MSDNYRRSPKPNNGLHRDCVAYTPTSYGQYAVGLGTLRANGGDIGGGSEVLIVDAYVFRDDITIKVDGGALPLPSALETTKECNV